MAAGMSGARLTFGIYPGSALGGVELGGPPDEPDRINQALDQLQGRAGRPFTVRAYDAYADPGDIVPPVPRQTPADYDRYLGRGRTLDLVAQYHSRSGDMAGFCAFVENLVGLHSEHLATSDQTEWARHQGRLQQHPFARPGRWLLHRPDARGRGAVRRRPGLHRPGLLPRCLPSGRGGSPGRRRRGPAGRAPPGQPGTAALGVTGYIHHALRDARSDGSGLFCRFGLMTDDYTPKPAFHVYRDLIARY